MRSWLVELVFSDSRFLLVVDPSQMAMTRSLRSTGITPLYRYKETASLRQQ